MKVLIRATIEVEMFVEVSPADINAIRGDVRGGDDETGLPAIAAYQKAFGSLPETHQVVDWSADVS